MWVDDYIQAMWVVLPRFPYEAKEKALPFALKNVFLQVFLSCFLRKQYNDAIMVIADDMVMEARLQ